MANKYYNLKPTALAPLYYFDGSPRLNPDGSHDCRPFAIATMQNWDLIKDQGTVRTQDEKGRPLAASEIKSELKGRTTSSLLGNVSPADILFFNPIEFQLVTADMELLIKLRSNRGASIGMADHFGGGFPKCVGSPPGPEPRVESALRETREEQEIRFAARNTHDLDNVTYDNEVSPFELWSADERESYPGFAPEILNRFGFHSRRTTDIILRERMTGSDNAGMLIIKPMALQSLALTGDPALVDYVPTTAQWAQRMYISANEKASPMSLSHIHEILNHETMPVAEKNVKNVYRYDLASRVASELSYDVIRKATVVSGLLTFKTAGIVFDPTTDRYIEEFRQESLSKMLVPKLMESRFSPAQTPRPAQ